MLTGVWLFRQTAAAEPPVPILLSLSFLILFTTSIRPVLQLLEVQFTPHAALFVAISLDAGRVLRNETRGPVPAVLPTLLRKRKTYRFKSGLHFRRRFLSKRRACGRICR